jgi:hypothetical protein
MAKYVPSDHGKVVDSKIVVFFQTPPADQAKSAGRPSPAERAETAKLQAATSTSAWAAIRIISRARPAAS